MSDEYDGDVITGERCPLCLQETLTLMERSVEVPHFGLTHIFSMQCENPDCDYGMADLESDENKPAYKETVELDSEEKMGWYIVKSSHATLKIPRMVEMTPGADAEGFITTIEGVLNRFKKILEELKQDDDKAVAKKAKNQLKKLQKVMWGQESVKLTIEDKTGNSMIIKERLELMD